MIISHRGKISTNQETENTILNFKRAIELNVSGIETDLRVTKDKEVILYHDKDVNGKHVKDLFLEEIRAIKHVNLLEDLLKLCENHKTWKGFINLELKTDDITEIVKILKRFPQLINRIIISSFIHPVAWNVKKKINVKIALLYGSYLDYFGFYLLKKPDFIIFDKDTIYADSFNKLRKICNLRKIKILVYGIESPQDISELNELNKIDGFIVDCCKDLSF